MSITSHQQLDPDLIKVYEDLLFARRSADEPDTTTVADDSLETLSSLGLVYRGDGDADPAVPVPPGVAATSLQLAISKQVTSTYEQLARFQRELDSLNRRYVREDGTAHERRVVRMLDDETRKEIVLREILGAESEVQVMLSPATIDDEQCLLNTVQLLNTLTLRGVRCTATCDVRLMKMPRFRAALDSLDPALGTVSTLPQVSAETWCIDRSTCIVARPRSLALPVLMVDCPALASMIADLIDNAHGSGARHAPAVDALNRTWFTPAHQRIAALLASGYRDEEIAGLLDVSVRTVRRYVSQLVDGLGAKTRFQAALLATREGLIPAKAC